MSYHFSRALVAEFSEATCSDGGASAPSNTTPMPEAFYWPDKTTEHSRLSRFGMTSEPLTADRGEALLTWYRAGFRARTSAQPAREQDWAESEADCGPRCGASFAKYDRGSSLWRTPQCSLLEDLDVFSETWPKWGSMRNGDAYLRLIAGRLISGSESGLWPTPTARDWRSESCTQEVQQQRASHSRGKTLAWVVMWPTPTVGGNSGGTLQEWGGSGNWVRDYPELARGLLNPAWVEWLMGWPIGWTELKPLETARFHEWQQQHSLSFPADSNDKQAA